MNLTELEINLLYFMFYALSAPIRLGCAFLIAGSVLDALWSAVKVLDKGGGKESNGSN